MTWRQLVRLGLALPAVEEGIWFRTPALKVKGKSFCRLKENGADVVFILESVDEQEALIAGRPKLYYITDHYKGYAAVLARLKLLSVREARVRLERGWRQKAGAKLVAAFEQKG